VISLNALFRRPVEYYEYPWAIEGHLRSAQSQFRSLFQASDVSFIFSKSMPRSGHRFLTECLTHYFGPELHYCGFYRPECCHRIPCTRPHGDGRANRYFMQKSHDFGFRDWTRLNGNIWCSTARRSRACNRTSILPFRVGRPSRAKRASPPSPSARQPTSSISTGNGSRCRARIHSPSPMTI
jgi:hypothetical protein